MTIAIRNNHVVSLLISQKRNAERISNKKDNTQLVSMTSELMTQSKSDFLNEYCLHLVKHSKPAKKATLLNSIKSKFKAAIDPEELIEELIRQGVINVKDDKITYNLLKLKKYAGQ